MEGPTLGPCGEDITWPNQVAPRGGKAPGTRKIKPQNSNHLGCACTPPPPPGARGAGRGTHLPANTEGHRRYGGPPSAAPLGTT